MKARPLCKHSVFTPELLVEYLRRDVPRFKDESVLIQTKLASMIWTGAGTYREHFIHKGYMSFHYLELKEAFKGQFEAINARVELFDVKETWWGDINGGGGFTKGYRLSPSALGSWHRFLASSTVRLTRLLSSDGKAIKTPPRAIASQDSAGVTTTRWQAANRATSMSLVPVSIPSLEALQRDLGPLIDERQRTGPSYPSLDHLVGLREKTTMFIRLAHTDVAGSGRVLHRYIESRSGRLFAIAVNLQNAPRVIRQAALSGMFDYDIENCHFAILVQMAQRSGTRCFAIEHYLSHKREVREAIAGALGISVNAAKKCLLSVMYGARASLWSTNAIPTAIGVAAAEKLYALPIFTKIVNDVKQARAAILKDRPLTRKGGLINDFGKSLQGGNAEERLAHLVMGIEAKALRACLDLCPDQIVLTQHDGFTSAAPLDTVRLESAIHAATGYTLRLQEEQVQVDLSGQLAIVAANELSKACVSANPSCGRGLRRIETPRKAVNSGGGGRVVRCLVGA